MNAREAAADVARAEGRKLGRFEVINRPLVRNGRAKNVGDKIEMSQADANILIAAGRLASPVPESKPEVGSKPKAKAGK